MSCEAGSWHGRERPVVFGFAWSDKEEMDLAGIPTESPSTREGLNDWMLEAKGKVSTN